MKRRKWLKIAGWILLTPILLIILVIILLYIPPIQNFACDKATEAASKATGMDITVGRIHLRFPLKLLVRDVDVVQRGDTLASLGSLSVRVQLLPLVRGRVEVDEVQLKEIKLDTRDLMPEMAIKGELGHFFLIAHGIDLSTQSALVNLVELSDTNLERILKDTVITQEPDTTASATIEWKVDLRKLSIDNVTFGMDMEGDSTSIATHIGNITLKDATADLKKMAFGMRQLTMDKSSVTYDVGTAAPTTGFDPSHIKLTNIKMEMDSLYYSDKTILGEISKFTMNERSGLEIASFNAKVISDSLQIRVPKLNLKTNHSEINVVAQTYWELIDTPTTGRLSARLDAFIGKPDVMLFLGSMPEAFKEEYPAHPLTIRAGTEGNLKQMQISRCRIDLPGAFSADLGGELYNITDSLKRTINADFKMETFDLNFLTTLAEMDPSASFVIPSNMLMDGKFSMEGSQINTALALLEGEGQLHLDAALNLSSEAYNADLVIKDLQVNHFLPHDSIYGVSATLSARGLGLDPMKKSAYAQANFDVQKFQYANINLSDVGLQATLRNALASFSIVSDNQYLRMTADGEYNLAYKYPDAHANIYATHIGLYELGLIPQPMKHNIEFEFGGEIRKENVTMTFNSGDLDFDLSVNGDLNQIISQCDRLGREITRQLSHTQLNLNQLREFLPTVMMDLKCGDDNLLAWYLAQQKMSYEDVNLKMRIEPATGINMDFDVYAFRLDTLQLDTVFFDLHQKDSVVNMKVGVINGAKNPMPFKFFVDGMIDEQLAALNFKFFDAKGREGLSLGTTMQQELTEEGKIKGYLFRLTPEEPILAFQPFRIMDDRNWVYYYNKTGRIYSSVMMQDKEGMGISVQSLPSDTISKQNIDVEIRRLQLGELFAMLPFMPAIDGVFNLQAHYIQTESSLQVSAETQVDSLVYEKFPMGDFSIGASWLPGNKGQQHVTATMEHNRREILNAEGALVPAANKKDSIMVAASIDKFPAYLANAFVDQALVKLAGGFSGDVNITGFTDAPLVNGTVTMDSLSAYSAQYGAQFYMGNEPIKVDNSNLLFNKFSIYTTSKNPFTINGNINFKDMMKPTANLRLLAKDYTLLNAKRTKESLVYGTVAIDMDATVRGLLSDLKVGGNIVLLSKTDVTYVLTDSPLTVSDRLGELVTFTNFADTASLSKEVIPSVTLGGVNLAMNVQIDPSVQLRVDLSADRSSYVQVQGGGDLSLKYTPQGGMNLTGRYTLSGGSVKYSLPVIPLKEFQVVSGSYVEWVGNPMDPILNFSAMEKIRASVAQDNGSSRMVLFDISIIVKNKLENLSLAFDIDAPEDATVQNQLAMMGPDERQKQAIAMLATGIYLADSGSSGGFNMGSALNSVLSSQINNLMGNIKGASVSVGVDNTSNSAGDNQTDYSISYSQKFFNDRFTIIIGGKVSTGANATNDASTFIDNVRLEYRLDNSSTRYLQVFYDKNYESILDGEVTDTGVGIVLRKKMDRLRELFQFSRKKREERKKKDEEAKRNHEALINTEEENKNE